LAKEVKVRRKAIVENVDPVGVKLTACAKLNGKKIWKNDKIVKQQPVPHFRKGH
jgi:hypothetical protein